MRALTPLLLLATLALGASCGGGYRYRHWTNPVEILAPENDPAPDVRVLISLRGADVFLEGGPLEMHVRLRVDNRGERALVLVGEEFGLFSADLVAFGPARFEPAEDVAPGAGRLYDLYFEFPSSPRGSFDLSAVNLAFGLDDGERLFRMTATFGRLQFAD